MCIVYFQDLLKSILVKIPTTMFVPFIGDQEGLVIQKTNGLDLGLAVQVDGFNGCLGKIGKLKIRQ